jgi:hypothetical protein
MIDQHLKCLPVTLGLQVFLDQSVQLALLRLHAAGQFREEVKPCAASRESQGRKGRTYGRRFGSFHTDIRDHGAVVILIFAMKMKQKKRELLQRSGWR